MPKFTVLIDLRIFVKLSYEVAVSQEILHCINNCYSWN